MNLNLIAAILSLLVVVIGLIEIFSLGDYSWSNYLSVIIFASVFLIEVQIMRKRKE